MVGGAILRRVQARAEAGEALELVTRTRAELDLTSQQAVTGFMAETSPDAVIYAAAKVGGTHANNTYPANFIYENLMIECTVIHAAFQAGVLEPTNAADAIAKIAGIKLCESYNRQHGVDYRSVMPTNLYGPGGNFHSENSHVLPALLLRFHKTVATGTEEVTLWGAGTPRREFLHVDDMAEAALFVLELDRETYAANTAPILSQINVGTGTDISILELAQMVARITGFQGAIVTDPSKPDGTPRKLMDVSRLSDMGWRARIDLEDGVRETYAWFLANSETARL